jgi:hypothetical protein
MLFDLQGKRRRVVQATYLMLAVLMGGGLVLFGIGGDVSGGLFDAFSERGGGSGSGDSLIRDRIEDNEKKVETNPANEAVRKALARDYYSLAAALPVGEDGRVPAEGQDDLRKAAANYQAYIALEPKKPDPSLALTALQIYDPNALNQPDEAQEAAALRARVLDDPESYLGLVQYATLAGDTRTADLAAQKAVDLAPKKQKKAVKAAAEQAKKPPRSSATQGATTTPAP